MCRRVIDHDNHSTRCRVRDRARIGSRASNSVARVVIIATRVVFAVVLVVVAAVAPVTRLYVSVVWPVSIGVRINTHTQTHIRMLVMCGVVVHVRYSMVVCVFVRVC